MAARAARGQSSRTLVNPQQSQARLQSDRLRHRVQRSSETPQQSKTRQEADRLRHFRQRASTWADMINAAFHYNPALNYEQFTFLQIGHMDKQCLHCTAFKYNGKTFLINLLLTKVRSTGDSALSTASSGIAATLLHGGRTAHSTFKLPLDLTRDEVFWIVFDFYLLKKMDQRTCIKFCVKNNIECADAFRMAYGEATLDRSNVYRWYKMFSEDREDVNDEERAGRPSTSTTDEKIFFSYEVEKMILANRRITVREVAEDLNISIGSFHSIFINDLGMRRVAAKFVPKLLNCDQKQHRMNIANEMLDSVRDDPILLQRVITGDEAWVYGYDVETKAQSSQWKLPHEPRPKKARQVRSNVKVLLTVFFDCRCVVHHEFLPQGRTANKEYYLQVMRNLREAIRQKRPDLWKNKNWLLHHDNAPAHTLLLVRDFLAKNNTLMMPQPPYSPDLAPCDFFLFPKQVL
ncbi:hypothetical protein LAZ67_14001920 [Cordylochernes scorpioides]|uniref:ATP-dependent DNA helicase n=1 Tax=Cordylochernes scorpioides TaxID=51811 RepID=A0ABY6L6I3_9ARAC|nr:hypothetical protein LAZ67_14001920 [Cordylochernes scorpioides]